MGRPIMLHGKPLKDCSDAELRAYYEANPEATMARRNPFAPERVITRLPADASVVPANLPAAAPALYQVVLRLVRNDGRMTSDDYTAAVEALRLAREA